MKAENPSNGISTYGYDDGGTFLPVPTNTTPGTVSPAWELIPSNADRSAGYDASAS